MPEPLIRVMQVARALDMLPVVVAEPEPLEEEMPSPIMAGMVAQVLHPVLRVLRFITAPAAADQARYMVAQVVRAAAETVEMDMQMSALMLLVTEVVAAVRILVRAAVADPQES